MTYLNGVLDIDQIITNQVISAKLAEQTLKDLEGEAEVKLSDIQGALDEAATLSEHIGPVLKERDELVAKVHTIQNENDQIKVKFAKLLDQFQEYVNENEIKMQEEEYKIRQNQEIVLFEMQSSIKDLDQLSKDLK